MVHWARANCVVAASPSISYYNKRLFVKFKLIIPREREREKNIKKEKRYFLVVDCKLSSALRLLIRGVAYKLACRMGVFN